MKTAASMAFSLAVLVGTLAAAQGFAPVSDPQPPPGAAAATADPHAASTAYRNDALQLTYAYPAPLKQQTVGSFQEAVQLGHREHFQVEAAVDPERAQTDRCMHVLFYAATPHAAADRSASDRENHPARRQTAVAAAKGTVTVSEFDQSCIPEGSEPNDVLASLAAMPGQLPGFQPIDQQMWYVLDKHKVHFLAAQGTFPEDATPTKPMIVAIASVEVHDHLLFWMFTADSMPLLNQLLNSPVQFDQHTAAPLFPLSIGDGPPVKPVP